MSRVSLRAELVRQVEEGDIVGERGPLEGTTRSATVRATTHMNTFAISRQRLVDLAERLPRARDGMFAYMRERFGD